MKIRLTLKKTNKLTFCVDFIKQLFCMNLFNFSTNSLFTGKSKLIDLLLIIIWKKKRERRKKVYQYEKFQQRIDILSITTDNKYYKSSSSKYQFVQNSDSRETQQKNCWRQIAKAGNKFFFNDQNENAFSVNFEETLRHTEHHQ